MLASRCAMSPRTFARRFRAETGTSTLHRWLTHQRVLLARRMLEEGDDQVDVVAARCGFGTGAMLRHHFARIVGVSPAAYRRAFRDRRPAADLLGKPRSAIDAHFECDFGGAFDALRIRSIEIGEAVEEGSGRSH